MGNIKLEVLTPLGATEVKAFDTARVPDLRGKTICELSNGSYRSAETLPVIRELLLKRFPGATHIPYTEFGYYHPHDVNTIGKIIKARGCDVLVAGNGG